MAGLKWMPKAGDSFYHPNGDRGKVYKVSEGVVDISPDRNVTPIPLIHFAPHPNGAPDTWILVGLRSDLIMDAAYLAARCKELSEDPTVDAAIAEEAHQLKTNWLRLAARGQGQDYKESDQIAADERAMTVRMAAFLEQHAPKK
jgi:hypothetical protein